MVVVVVAVRVLAIVDALRNFARIGRNSSEIKEELSGRVSAKTTELTLKIQGGQIRIMIFVFVCFSTPLSC